MTRLPREDEARTRTADDVPITVEPAKVSDGADSGDRVSLIDEPEASGRYSSFVQEVLLGVVICFAQIPESIAFALMAHVRPPVALHAAWVVGLICGVFGGRPGMINGATGAFAAVICTFLPLPARPGQNAEGVETLFPSVVCAGLLMLLVARLRHWNWNGNGNGLELDWS